MLVICAGAAGSAAIPEFARHEEFTSTAIIDAEVAPYNRTLINDAVRSEVHAEFADGRDITADLVVTALGTRPIGPSPWDGPIDVDSYVRSYDHENICAAGGVAVLASDGVTWRIVRWRDAEAQGAHAARSVLASLGPRIPPAPADPAFSTVRGSTTTSTSLLDARADSGPRVPSLPLPSTSPTGERADSSAPAAATPLHLPSHR